MALRVQTPQGLIMMKPSYAASKSCRSTSVRANLKQKPKKQNPPNSSPTEEIAFEMTVLELERLFRRNGNGEQQQRRRGRREGERGGGDPFVPLISGPSSPSTGSSGRPVRVAYQGVRGSYCQEAALKAFSSVCNAIACNKMEDAFEALEDRSADRAIIPVENSIDGTIDRNLDLLLRHDNVEIVGELILPVNHCLLATPGTSRSQLNRIVSHPQALSHCRSNLQWLDLEIDEVPNAADAARFISDNQISDTAVIGSKIAAKEFGLQVLEQNFQDQSENFNRFLQLGLVPSLPRRERFALKKTVAFSLNNGVSDLFRALEIFEKGNVTVTRVEHRPNRSSPVKVVEKETGEYRYFDYVFILDLEGDVSDSSLKPALSRLEKISGFVRVLGSYTCGLVQ